MVLANALLVECPCCDHGRLSGVYWFAKSWSEILCKPQMGAVAYGVMGGVAVVHRGMG